MAKDSRTKWVAVFRWPADNYEHDHVAEVSSVGPRKSDALNALVANTNPDVRDHVSELVPMESREHLLDVTARVIGNGGSDYRGYGGSEQFLTVRRARQLRMAEGLSVSNLPEPGKPTTAEAKVAEARAEVFADPPLIVPAQ